MLSQTQVKYPTTGALLLDMLDKVYEINLETFVYDYFNSSDDPAERYYQSIFDGWDNATFDEGAATYDGYCY